MASAPQRAHIASALRDPAAEMTLAGGSPGVGAHRRDPGQGLLPASPFQSLEAATGVTLVGRPLHCGEAPVGGNGCDSVPTVFVVADGVPPCCALRLPPATQTEPGSNIYLVPMSLSLFLHSLPLEKIQRAWERLSTPLQTFLVL